MTNFHENYPNIAKWTKSCSWIEIGQDEFMPLPESYTREGLLTIAGVTYIGNNSKAKRKLGFNPRSLKESLSETLEHEMKLLGMK